MVRKLLEETVKILCKDVEIEGHFTNHILRARTATQALQKGIPERFVMKRNGRPDGHRCIIIKYQRPDTSSKIEILKKFDCCGQFFTLNRLFPWIFSIINLNY